MQHAASVELGVRVGKAVSVTVPAGTFSTTAVQITGSGQTQTAWYMTKAPHALVRYVNGKETFVLTAPNQCRPFLSPPRSRVWPRASWLPFPSG